jgi:hypothetical protein
LYNDWRDDYGSFSCGLSIEALARVVITFELETVFKDDALLVIVVNGEEYHTVKETDTKELAIELQAGESVSFSLIVQGAGEEEVRIYLHDVVVRELSALDKE